MTRTSDLRTWPLVLSVTLPAGKHAFHLAASKLCYSVLLSFLGVRGALHLAIAVAAPLPLFALFCCYLIVHYSCLCCKC